MHVKTCMKIITLDYSVWKKNHFKIFVCGLLIEKTAATETPSTLYSTCYILYNIICFKYIQYLLLLFLYSIHFIIAYMTPGAGYRYVLQTQ